MSEEEYQEDVDEELDSFLDDEDVANNDNEQTENDDDKLDKHEKSPKHDLIVSIDELKEHLEQLH